MQRMGLAGFGLCVGPLSLTEVRIATGSTGEKWCRARSI